MDSSEPPLSTSEAARSPERDEPADAATSDAIKQALRSTLTRGDAVTVPGLGTFRVTHHGSRIERQDDGTFAVHPPCEKLVFAPESASHDDAS